MSWEVDYLDSFSSITTGGTLIHVLVPPFQDPDISLLSSSCRDVLSYLVGQYTDLG